MTPAARRIAVVGVTGCGKTTFAAALAAALDLTYVELDALHWEPSRGASCERQWVDP